VGGSTEDPAQDVTCSTSAILPDEGTEAGGSTSTSYFLRPHCEVAGCSRAPLRAGPLYGKS